VAATITHAKSPNKGSISLQITGGNAPFSFEWTYNGNVINPSNPQNLTDLNPGIYCVVVNDAKCCAAEQCFTIRQECPGDEAVISYKKNQTDCGDKKTPGAGNGKIEIDVSNPADYTYCWKQYPTEPTCRFTTQNIQDLGVSDYFLTVTNRITGCKTYLQTSICCCYDPEYDPDVLNTTLNPFACNQVYMPTAFSPNDDNINDLYRPFCSEAVETIAFFQVYDRWGTLIYSVNNFSPSDNIGWDGTYKNQIANQDIYTYVVQIKLRNGQVQKMLGDVMLMRNK
jgi:gliding motility-associated-like protein